MAKTVVFSVAGVQTGPVCKITNFDAQTFTKLGETRGGGTFTKTTDTLDITSDQTNGIIATVGTNATSTLVLNMTTELANSLKKVGTFSDTTHIYDSSQINYFNGSFRVDTRTGSNLDLFVLKIPNGQVDPSFELALTNDDSTVIPVTIKCLEPEASTVTGIGWTNGSADITKATSLVTELTPGSTVTINGKDYVVASIASGGLTATLTEEVTAPTASDQSVTVIEPSWSIQYATA